MTTKIERYINWRNQVTTAWLVESEFPMPSFPEDYLLTLDGELIRETLCEDALVDREYRPNFVHWLTELSDGSWVLHREDGPAQILAQTDNRGSWMDDYTKAIGAGITNWYLSGKLVDPFTAGQAPLIELSVTEL